MKRTTCALLVLAAVTSLSLPAFAAGWPVPPTKLVVQVSSPGGVVGYADKGQLVEMTVSNPRGVVVAVARAVADGTTGLFTFGSIAGPYGGPQQPGDTLKFVLGDDPAYTYATVYPNLAITGFNLGTGTISGRVTPRPAELTFGISGSRLIADDVTVAEPTNVSWGALPGFTPAGDGRFSFKPLMSGTGWTGTIRRTDGYVAQANYPLAGAGGDPNFMLAVVEQGWVPGFVEAEIGTSFATLQGPRPHNFTARLASPTGLLKGTAAGSIGYFAPFAYFDFRKADGRAGVIAPGDTIKVAGVGGFPAVVPRLQGIIDTAANNATISAKPNSFVKVLFRLFNDAGNPIPGPPESWVKTDAAGIQHASAGAFTLRERDWVDLWYVDPAGNSWVTRSQALP
jgi:hypothetical protein